jgi:hypothetical protein
LGFKKENDVIYAVVQQNFVSITSSTDLKKVKEFLTINGFVNNRNNDYVNSELGIILEDLHDEMSMTIPIAIGMTITENVTKAFGSEFHLTIKI